MAFHSSITNIFKVILHGKYNFQQLRTVKLIQPSSECWGYWHCFKTISILKQFLCTDVFKKNQRIECFNSYGGSILFPLKKLFGFMFINAQYSRSKRTFIYLARSIDLHEIKMPEGYTWSTVGAQRIWLKTFGSIKSIADKIPLSINAVGFSKHVLSGFNLPKENMLELWGFMCFWDMSSQIAKELWHN